MIVRTYFASLFSVGGQTIYTNTLLDCHFCIQIIAHHFLPSKVPLPPYSCHSMNKCTLIIPYLIPLEVFHQPQIIILSVMYFGLFPWEPMLYNILPLFLYLGRKWVPWVQWDLRGHYGEAMNNHESWWCDLGFCWWAMVVDEEPWALMKSHRFWW